MNDNTCSTDFRALHQIYTDELFQNILPFWIPRGVDAENGGFFTCFTNRGDRLLHKHKFIWSQGRFIWMLARLYRDRPRELSAGILDQYLEHARRGAEFLMQHALLPNGNCSFILSETGEPMLLDAEGRARKAGPGEEYDTSVYADLFVVYGVAEYAVATNDEKAFRFAAELYERASRRFRQPVYRSDPYPVPAGYEAHGRPMILLDTGHELSNAAAHFNDSRLQKSLLAEAEAWMADILDKFRDPQTNLIRDMYSASAENRQTMLGSYINPGHTLESMWFIMHLARRLGAKERLDQAVDVILADCEAGWDKEFGGFYQFAHWTGGAPKGPVPDSLKDAEMIKKLRENWDNKLWWPHSEALYALLLAYEHSGDAALLAWHKKVHEYTFRTFPNPDRNIGEWIQIRDRKGAPVDKVVALPVKDPFHITRSLILCRDVLNRLCS